MELCELLCTINVNQVNNINFDGQDVYWLLHFMTENNVSYSMLNEFDNNLSDLNQSIINDLEFDDSLEDNYIKEIKADLRKIENEYRSLFNKEVFIQSFKAVDEYKINITLR